MITITIKGLSKEAHRELKKRAATHGRSLNTEAIAVLEASVRSQPVNTRDLLLRLRAMRPKPKMAKMAKLTGTIPAGRMKREGRP
jgi:plasmid stability protein